MAIVQEQIEQAVALAKEFGATRLILFGSAATTSGQARDLDLACEGVPGWKLYELGARLEKELRIPLDLVPLSPKTPFTRLIEERGRALAARQDAESAAGTGDQGIAPAYLIQLTTRSLGTRENSRTLLVTKETSKLSACAAIRVSSDPIGVPCCSRAART